MKKLELTLFLTLSIMTTGLAEERYVTISKITSASEDNFASFEIESNETLHVVYLHHTNDKQSTNAVTHAIHVYKPVDSTTNIYLAMSISPNIYDSRSRPADNVLPVIKGPARLELHVYHEKVYNPEPDEGFHYTVNMACLTAKITTEESYFTPQTGVVVPADDKGPVNIIMESSVDLVNWNEAQPGSYGTTTSNRFFRLKAVR